VALSALLFLYRDVLKKDLAFIEGIERAKRPERLPVVFRQTEVKEVLASLEGVNHLVAALLYGCAVRWMGKLMGEGVVVVVIRRGDLPFSIGHISFFICHRLG
jgi:integrase